MLRRTHSTKLRLTPTPTRAQANVVRESLKRCSQRQDFIARLQEHFHTDSATVQSNVCAEEFEQIHQVINASFYFLLLLSMVTDDASVRMVRNSAPDVAQRQGKVASKLVNTWIGSILETVRECDPQFNPMVESAWRVMIAFALAQLPPVQRKAGREPDESPPGS